MPIHAHTLTVERPSFLEGGQWMLENLNCVNVLFGRNGSGKSLLLRKLRDQDMDSYHYIVPERSGDISFEPGLILEVIEAGKRRNSSQSNFSSNYRQQIITRIQGYYTHRGTKNISEINHDPGDLLSAMAILLPDFTVRVKSETPFYDLRRTKDSTSVTTVTDLSSGESQLLALGLDIATILGIWELDRKEKRILLIDEPDAHIHPDLQIKLADFLCHIEQKFKVQIFVATHSTTLLAALGQFGGQRVSLLLMNKATGTIRAEPLSRVTKELSALLGGHLLMGPLFGAPVLLVEGDDDYRVWVQVARSGNISLCVLPCNGEEIKRYQKSLEKLFAALSESDNLRGIALVDGDKYQADLPNATYVPFMKLNCHETENLYLTDETLGELGIDWAAACEKIKTEAPKYGMKTSGLLAIAQPACDRRRVDLKGVITQVAEILDPKGLLWTVRLGKAIGRGRPEGMLADFIGVQLMKVLWPRT